MRLKTYLPTEKDFDRKTYLIDASGKTLGRLATRIASLLIGKGKVVYTPDRLCGDRVVVVNAEKVHVTGKKFKGKMYTHYTGYAGGLRTYSYEELMAKKPHEVLMRAVARMLPHNKLGSRMLKSLRVYTGPVHTEQSHKPIPLEMKV